MIVLWILQFYFHFYLEVGQVRPYLQSTLMQRMTDVLCRMLHTTSQRAGSQDEDIQNDASVPDGGAAQNAFPPWDVSSSADRFGNEEVDTVPSLPIDISSRNQDEPPSSSGSQVETPSQISSQSISVNSPDSSILAPRESSVLTSEAHHESPPKRVKDDTAASSSASSSHERLLLLLVLFLFLLL